MATRSVIKSVLWNFLGTYVSRYSDYDGYWLFGFLVDSIEELRINIWGHDTTDPTSPLGVAVLSAAEKFKEQCKKADLLPLQIREAWLTISKLPGSARGPVNGRPSDGFRFKFTAETVTDLGKHYKKERIVFIAPHSDKNEIRSTRAGQKNNI